MFPWHSELFNTKESEIDPEAVFDDLLSFYNEQLVNKSDEE